MADISILNLKLLAKITLAIDITKFLQILVMENVGHADGILVQLLITTTHVEVI